MPFFKTCTSLTNQVKASFFGVHACAAHVTVISLYYLLTKVLISDKGYNIMIIVLLI